MMLDALAIYSVLYWRNPQTSFISIEKYTRLI